MKPTSFVFFLHSSADVFFSQVQLLLLYNVQNGLNYNSRIPFVTAYFIFFDIFHFIQPMCK